MAKKGHFFVVKNRKASTIKEILFNMDRRDIGVEGEKRAVEFLKKQGYRIRERNYANTKGIRVGEIDIIAEKEGRIVFVEVKALFQLSGKEERLPEWQVQRGKLARMERIAAFYLRKENLEERDYSFDVIAVTLFPAGSVEIHHLESVFYT